MLVGSGICQQYFCHSLKLGGRVSYCLAILACDEHVNITADRFRGGERLVGCILERFVVVLGDEKRGHLEHPRLVFKLADQLRC